ncbi:MAG: TMEM14 family protein [Armatimonadota bacterium]
MNTQVMQAIAGMYGLIVMGGGLSAATKSKISLYAGVGTGLFAIAGALLMAKNPKLGLILLLIGAIAPLPRMLPGFIKTQAVWPAGVVSLCAIAVIISAVLAFNQLKPQP